MLNPLSSTRATIKALFWAMVSIAWMSGCSSELVEPTPGTSPDSSFTIPEVEPWQPPAPMDVHEEVAQPSFAINEISPPSGSIKGLEMVQIKGAGFVDGTRVFFGSQETPEVYVQSPEQLTALSPAHPQGSVDVIVRRPDGRMATLPDGFTYVGVVEVAAVQPPSGPSRGGTAITITGAGFSDAAEVIVGDRLAPTSHVVDDRTILAVTPIGAPGLTDIFVTDGGQAGRLKDAFRYEAAPSIDRLIPNYGPLEGGTAIVVKGTGLDSEGLSIRFADTPAELLEQEAEAA